MKNLFFLSLLFLAPLCHSADPRFPFPETKHQIWQNDLDLRDDISRRMKLLDSEVQTSTITTSLVLSDGTNDFTESMINYAYWQVASNYQIIFIDGVFATGGTATGDSLHIASLPFEMDTSNYAIQLLGFIVVVDSAGTEPRTLEDIAVVSSTEISVDRNNGDVWDTSTTYGFNLIALLPVPRGG